MHGPLSLDDSISIEESRRLIDEAIAQHQASILALKSQQNSLAPVSYFPPEILCRIFSFVKKEFQGRHDNWTRYRLRWIIVTHVSSHWRHVAINSPSLWIDPPLQSIRWVQEMLQRSKDAGLVIEANLSSQEIRTIIPGLKLALKHGSQIKHLMFQDISYTSVSAWNNLQKALPTFAPQLEHLSVMVDEYERPRMFDPEYHNPIAISEQAFCETPHLRYLELSQCNPSWNTHTSLFRSLTSLTLCHIALDAKPTGKQFMDALKRMPDLEFLKLIDAFPVEQNWDSEKICLASLRTLSINSIHTQIETFLRCVTFPPTARVKIECSIITNRASTSYTNVTEVILNLSRSYANLPSNMTFRTLALLRTTAISYFGFLLKLFTDAVDEEQVESSFAAASLELEFVWRTELEETLDVEYYVPKLVADIFNGAMPLQDVAMHINLAGIGDKLRSETIANTFGTLPQLRTVKVDNYSSRRFLGALKYEPSTEEANSTDLLEKFYFPNLSSIQFNETMFWKSGWAEVMQNSISVSFESLKDWLFQRFESGARIEKLTFKCCRELSKTDLESLSPAVGEIGWDNIEVHTDTMGYSTVTTGHSTVIMGEDMYESEEDDSEEEEEYYNQEETYEDEEMEEQEFYEQESYDDEIRVEEEQEEQEEQEFYEQEENYDEQVEEEEEEEEKNYNGQVEVEKNYHEQEEAVEESHDEQEEAAEETCDEQEDSEAAEEIFNEQEEGVEIFDEEEEEEEENHSEQEEEEFYEQEEIYEEQEMEEEYYEQEEDYDDEVEEEYSD